MRTKETAADWNKMMKRKFGRSFWDTIEGKTVKKHIQNLEQDRNMMKGWFEIFSLEKTPAIFPVQLREIAESVLSQLSIHD